MIKLVARQFLSSNSTFIVPCSCASFSVPDLTEVETPTQEILNHENHDLAIARSSSSRADPGLRMAFKYLNV